LIPFHHLNAQMHNNSHPLNCLAIKFLQLNQDKRHLSSIHIQELLLRQTISTVTHVLLLQEPQIPSQISNYHIFPPKSFCRSPRASIVCHRDLQAAFIAAFSSRDICMVRMVYRERPLILISVYCHKFTNLNGLLDNIPGHLLDNCVIAMDSNASSPKWGAHTTCSRGRILENWLSHHDLHPVNVLPHPPSFQQASGCSFIDTTVVSSSILPFLTSWSSMPQNLFFSGHTAFSFELKPCNNLFFQQFCYDIKSLDKNAFIATFRHVFWSDPLPMHYSSSSDIDDAIQKLSRHYFSAFNETVTLKQFKTRINPWWNKELHQLQQQSRKLLAKYRKHPRSPSAASDFRTHRNLYSKSILAAKKKWLSTQCQSLAHPFQILRWIKNMSMGAISFLNDDEDPIIDPNLNAAHLLDSLIVEDCPDLLCHKQIVRFNDSFLKLGIEHIPMITEAEIRRSLQSMKPYGAPGPDSTRVFMVQWTKSVVVPFLAPLFSACLRHSYFPLIFKHGILKAIPKPNATSFDSHKALRPISLLNILGKLFERIILKLLETHLHSSLHTQQFGFTRGRSPEQAHAQYLHFVESNVSGPIGVASIQLDIAKAYDRVWHPALMNSLIHLGTPIFLCKIIASFLSNRSISVQYANGYAEKSLTLSVPQGAVLSPFLWKVFLNPLLVRMSINPGLHIIAWADDILLSTVYNKKEISNLKSKLTNFLRQVHSWCVEVKATISADKSTLVCFQTHTSQHFDLDTPFGMMSTSPCLKFLGVTFDSKLSFKNHVQNVIHSCSSLQHSMASFYSRSLKMSPKAIHSIFLAVIVPKIFFSCTTWCTVLNSISLLGKLQHFLNVCSRYSTRAIRTTPIPFLSAVTNTLSASQLVEHHVFRTAARLLLQPNSSLRSLLATRPSTHTLTIISQLVHDAQLPWTFSSNVDRYCQSTLFHLANVQVSHSFDRFCSFRQNDVVFFTDGSKMCENQAVGLAFNGHLDVTFNNTPWTFKMKLPNLCSNNDAEGWAIFAVILSIAHTFLSRFPTSNPNFSSHWMYESFPPSLDPIDVFPPLAIPPSRLEKVTYHIYTDSQISLSAILNPLQSSNSHLFCSILNIVQALPVTVFFHWIPSHAGHFGNELADTHAKQAANSSCSHSVSPILFPSKSHLKMLVRGLYEKGLMRNWTSLTSKRPSLLKFFDSFTTFQTFLLGLHKYPSLVGVISGHLPLRAHLYKCSLVDHPNCMTCGFEEDIRHVLFYCPRFDSERLDFLHKLNLSLSQFTMNTIHDFFQLNDTQALSTLDIFIGQSVYTLKRKSGCLEE
jgi:Reverse transcriptase (RNA-dependent DNA polymerase)/Endonuclease-reverse transcriptase/RNase H